MARVSANAGRWLPIAVATLWWACGDQRSGLEPDLAADAPVDVADLGDAASIGTDRGDASAVDDADGCGADRLQWGLGGALMLPGTDCLDCHRVGGSADNSVYSIAGTVFVGASCPEGVEGAEVHVVDAADRAVALVTNALGNFSTDEVLEPPYRTWIVVDGVETTMLTTFSNGSCGACHSDGSGLGFVYGGR